MSGLQCFLWWLSGASSALMVGVVYHRKFKGMSRLLEKSHQRERDMMAVAFGAHFPDPEIMSDSIHP